MKKQIKLTLFLFIILFDSALQSQDDYFNTQKYWKLRSRLHESFVSVGEGHGKSLVFQNVHTGNQCIHSPHHYSIAGGDILLHHGWYLSVLATELHLLKAHNLEVGKTIMELYYALKAVDRLDLYAEDLSNYFYEYTWDEVNQSYNATPNPVFQSYHDDEDNDFSFPWENNGHYANNLNGFLIRDDIPPDFHENFGEKFEKSNFSCATPHSTKSIDGQDRIITNADEMSHDQLIHLLMGLKFVTQYVPGNIEINGYNLVENAAKQAYRLFMQYFWNNNDLAPLVFDVKNPATQRRVLRGDPSIVYIYPIAHTVLNILSNVSGFPETLFNNFMGAYYLTVPQSVYWYAPYLSNFWAIQPPEDNKANFSINLHMTLCLAAISNTWFNGIPDLSRVNMYNYGKLNHQQKEIYYLISRALYNLPVINNWFSSGDIKNLMNEMCCEGPNRYHLELENASIDRCSYHWDRNNRWVEYSMIYHESGHESEFDGEFPGLDYMLLHNLFYIIHNDESEAQFENFKDMHVRFQYPRFDDHYLGFTNDQAIAHGNGNTIDNFISYGNDWAYSVIGSHSNPVFFRAFDFIHFSNVITWNGNVTAHSGKEISWYPGFEVEPGGYFEAYVKPIECNALKGFHRQTNPDTLSNEQALPLKKENFIIDRKPVDLPKLSSSGFGNIPSFKSKPMHVFPNPANETIALALPIEQDELVSLEIIDLQGKLCRAIKSKIQDSQISINISTLKEGLYLIKAIASNQIFQAKFQKINQ
jgi:hypothetical protein